MRNSSTLFLRIVIFLVAIAVLIFGYFAFPDLDGNIMREFTVSPTFTYIGVIGFYLSALPFYFALYQGWKLLNYIDQNEAFSTRAVESLRQIKYSALIMSGFYLMGMPLIFQVAQSDDAPGLILMGLAFALAPTVICVFAAVVESVLKKAVGLKTENDLTV